MLLRLPKHHLRFYVKLCLQFEVLQQTPEQKANDLPLYMLDIIFESRIPDMCEIYRWGDMYDTVIGMYKAGKDTFVSAYEKAEPGTIADMELTIEIFKSLQEDKWKE